MGKANKNRNTMQVRFFTFPYSLAENGQVENIAQDAGHTKHGNDDTVAVILEGPVEVLGPAAARGALPRLHRAVPARGRRRQRADVAGGYCCAGILRILLD